MKVSFFQRTSTTDRILSLSGGSGKLNKFIGTYRKYSKSINVPGTTHPVILLIDNDDGAKSIFKCVNKNSKSTASPKKPFIFVNENLYVVPTPLTTDGKSTMIEDFFEPSLKKTKLSEKTFNPSEKGFNAKTEYGKNHFAKYVVLKNQATIDFTGFEPILKRIESVLDDYGKKTH